MTAPPHHWVRDEDADLWVCKPCGLRSWFRGQHVWGADRPLFPPCLPGSDRSGETP